MRLSNLLKPFVSYHLPLDPEVTNLSLNSSQVETGTAFMAVVGTKCDGKQFIPQALANKAAAILAESDQDHIEAKDNIPFVFLKNLKHKVAALAARFYGYPAEKLTMIGVTGTSGKTSCTHYIAQCLTQDKIKCGVIGTLGYGFIDDVANVGLTTPDAIKLQAILSEFLGQGAKAIAMEVSSHAIDQGRINDIDYQVGVFTNLSQDHLDYHGNMQAYAEVKHRYLTSNKTKTVVLNLDDRYAKKWHTQLVQEKKVITFSCLDASADVKVAQANYQTNGILAEVITPWGHGTLELPLLGAFNLSNALAVISVLGELGIPFTEIIQKMAQIQPVPGRMQCLGGNNQPLVIVDYAHKPDALEKALQAIRGHAKGKLICVFGCGGERDRGKRQLMAQIAEQHADQVIVTNDNPRHESPMAIAQEIMQGFKRPDRAIIELDRSKAIQKSIQWATENDCILIAGKGAEHYQQIGDQKIPFDDVEVVKRYLS